MDEFENSVKCIFQENRVQSLNKNFEVNIEKLLEDLSIVSNDSLIIDVGISLSKLFLDFIFDPEFLFGLLFSFLPFHFE